MIRIIGIGSPFGDDAAGLEAARRIAEDPPAESEVVLADRPGIALIDLLRDVPIVVVIDAVRSGHAPGTVHDLALGEVARLAGRRFTSHDASLPEALALAEALGHALRGRFLGVEIGEPSVENVAAGFTVAVENGLREVTARARRWAAFLAPQVRLGKTLSPRLA
jgi:hydrogenase maturation protease